MSLEDITRNLKGYSIKELEDWVTDNVDSLVNSNQAKVTALRTACSDAQQNASAWKSDYDNLKGNSDKQISDLTSDLQKANAATAREQSAKDVAIGQAQANLNKADALAAQTARLYTALKDLSAVEACTIQNPAPGSQTQ